MAPFIRKRCDHTGRPMEALRRMKGLLWLFLIGPLLGIVVGVLVILVSVVVGLFR